jgi:serine/threonine protein kinase
MSKDSRVGDLLLAWEEAKQFGRPLSPEELCAGCPELLAPLRERIRLLRAMDTALDLSAYEESPARDVGNSPPPAPSSVAIPGHEILEEIGRGGMGVVYKARHLGLDRVVALKMILAGKGAGPEERARFEAEARAAAKLNHPQIVHVYETGEQDGCPYFTMEYLSGGSLEDTLHGRPLPPHQAAAVVESLARAVHYAHRQGIIHRDLKPGNVLLAGSPESEKITRDHRSPTPDPQFPSFKIADFGLARQLGSKRLSLPGNAVGTPAFMAPEQAGDGGEVGAAADVYSLGAILYQLLTGRPPFEGKSAWQILNRALHQTPTPPGKLRPNIPPVLEAVCLRCLEKSPGRRYPTAEGLADDLRRFLDGVPAGPQPGGPNRFGRRVAVAGAVLLTALLVPGIFFLLRQAPTSPAPVVPPPIHLGLLRPTAGPSVPEGATLVEAALLAIDQINARGGVLGRSVQEVLLDTGTERGILPNETGWQLNKQRDMVLLGGLTAQIQDTLQPAFKHLDTLLIYPGPADGVLSSEYVVSPRPTPAQSVLPVVNWLFHKREKQRFFLVGSDSLYPRAAFEMLRQYLNEELPGVEVVGEAYLPESESRTKKIVDAIPKEDSEPDVILNLLHDDATLDLFREAQAADFRAPRTVIVTLRFGDRVLRGLRDPKKAAAGQYLVGNYFSALPGEANALFKQQLHRKYRDQRRADDTAVAAYVGVHLWARAVEKAGTDDPAAVRKAIHGLSFDGPAGPVRIESGSGYARSVVRIARVEPDGTLHVEREWKDARDPAPFYGHPPEKNYWNFLLGYWHRNWSGRDGPPRWFNPGGKTRILPVYPDEADGLVR